MGIQHNKVHPKVVLTVKRHTKNATTGTPPPRYLKLNRNGWKLLLLCKKYNVPSAGQWLKRMTVNQIEKNMNNAGFTLRMRKDSKFYKLRIRSRYNTKKVDVVRDELGTFKCFKFRKSGFKFEFTLGHNFVKTKDDSVLLQIKRETKKFLGGENRWLHLNDSGKDFLKFCAKNNLLTAHASTHRTDVVEDAITELKQIERKENASGNQLNKCHTLLTRLDGGFKNTAQRFDENLRDLRAPLLRIDNGVASLTTDLHKIDGGMQRIHDGVQQAIATGNRNAKAHEEWCTYLKRDNGEEIFKFENTRTFWSLDRKADCFGVNEGGLPGLLKSDTAYQAIKTVDKPKSLILLTGACHYLFENMITDGKHLPHSVCTSKEQVQPLKIEMTLGELIHLIEKVDDNQYRSFRKAGATNIEEKLRITIRMLKRLSSNMETKIVVVREVFNCNMDKAKPAWASVLEKEVDQECEIILDIGSEKMAPTYPDGTQHEDLYAEYKTGSSTDEVRLTKGIHLDNSETITFEEYVGRLKKAFNMKTMIARYTGIFRNIEDPEEATQKRQATFEKFLIPAGVTPEILAIEDEGYYGSKHMLEIATPFIEDTDIKHVLILESGSGSFQGARYTRLGQDSTQHDMINDPMQSNQEEKLEPENSMQSTLTKLKQEETHTDDLAIVGETTETRPRSISPAKKTVTKPIMQDTQSNRLSLHTSAPINVIENEEKKLEAGETTADMEMFGGFAPKDRVRIVNGKHAGKAGVVVQWVAGKTKWGVKLDTNENKAFSNESMQLEVQTDNQEHGADDIIATSVAQESQTKLGTGVEKLSTQNKEAVINKTAARKAHQEPNLPAVQEIIIVKAPEEAKMTDPATATKVDEKWNNAQVLTFLKKHTWKKHKQHIKTITNKGYDGKKLVEIFSKRGFKAKAKKAGFTSSSDLLRTEIMGTRRRRLASHRRRLENRPIHMLAKLIQQAQA